MHTKILLLFLLIGLVAKIEARQELDAKYLHLMKGETFFELLHGSESPWFIALFVLLMNDIQTNYI